MKTQIFINHIGFLPEGSKHFVIKYPKSMEFSVIDRADNKLVFNGRLTAVYGGDIDEAFVGCFSEVTKEGTYLIKCGEKLSNIIVIHSKPYEMALRTIYNYFQTQRCGDSETGWNSPCHMREVKDINTGELKDMSGGWHQSCDTRKWMFGTTIALLALPELGECKAVSKWENGKASEEIKWGNTYFHKMVRKDGGLMDFVCVPNDWDTYTRRELESDDAPYVAFFTMISGQCKSAIYFKEKDKAYADKCLNYALRLWEYTNSSNMKSKYSFKPMKYHDWLPYALRKSFKGSSAYYGDRLYAVMMLYKATRNKMFLDEAKITADNYCRFQVGGNVKEDIAAACFWSDEEKTELNGATIVGAWGPIGLCLLMEEVQADDERGNVWLETIRKISKQLVISSGKNPWGLVPNYWYEKDIGGCRKGGSYYYKYFFYERDMVLGVNYDLLHKALFLLKSAKFTEFAHECKTVAGRQVDWVLGCNPLNASSCEGVGYNQPQMLINHGEFIPPVPQIPGAVQAGMGCVLGTDSPNIHGDPLTCEYDMPCTAMLMWTIKEMLQKNH